ncbi:TonB-dependent receptor [Flavobacterium agricola]|uniref:TonB-dependent receptor n=1 Tax=Flavobacterium agricola TaxID=2870839 RepID=A0ABY6M3M2_9FLAO|nr:TonB-dependent receptor [Flavobacterium agricola]UYW01613.1 TonB-dependent receptor [Flavobacterium agricola]
MWSWANKQKNIRNNFSVNYSFNKDDVNYEEEAADEKIVKNDNKSIAISNNFNWKFNDAFFDNLMVNANFRYGNQYSFESRYVNVGGRVVGTSKEPGVYEGVYSLPSYLLTKEVEGKPISGFAAVEVNKSFYAGQFENNITLGTDFRISDNIGRGQLGEPETLSNFFGSNAGKGGSGFRPYNYGQNVLTEYQVALFAEDNIIRYWGNSVLNMNLGARFDYQYGIANLSPRINAFYAFDKFKIRGGYGISTKSPALSQIYTGVRYHDVVLADLRLPGYYSMGVVQTFVDRADNPDLKPSKAHKAEVGFDVELNKSSTIGITAFYNTLNDGITGENRPAHRDIAELDITYYGTEKPTYQISHYNHYYFQQMFYENSFKSVDKGLELMASFRQLPIPGLSINVTGSYIETSNYDKTDLFYFTKDVTKNEAYGVYEKNPVFYKQMQFTTDFSYHIPKVGLIVSVKSEHFIMNSRSSNRIETPYAYLDRNLNRYEIPVADRNNTDMYGHIINKNSLLTPKKLAKTYHNFHLRLTKDFLNGFKFSFYSNNFLDLRPTEYIELTDGTFIEQNYEPFVKLSFGTRIEYSF